MLRRLLLPALAAALCGSAVPTPPDGDPRY
jgi:hypothetical protein